MGPTMDDPCHKSPLISHYNPPHYIQEKGETRREGPWKVGWLGSFGAVKLEGSVAEPTREPGPEIWCRG